MKVETIGLKGFRRENGEWSWTPEIIIQYEGDAPALLPQQIENISNSLDALKGIIQTKVESWTPPAPVQQAGPEPPTCIECRSKCVPKQSRSGTTYFYCPSCKSGRRRDGTPFPEAMK